jgi:uncharacterized protein YvpB
LGWIDGNNSLTDLSDIKDENQTAVMGYSGNGDAIWSVPFGEYGAKFVAFVNQYSYQPVKVVQSARKGQTTWNKIMLGDNVLGWVDSQVYSNVTNVNMENRLALVGDTDGNSVWTAPFGEKGAAYIGPASNYVNRPIQLIRSLDKDGVHWYQFNVDGHLEGWIDARAISNASDIRYLNDTGHISNAGNHAVWTVPYGLQHASYVGSAWDFANRNLHLLKVLNLNGITWYQIETNGRTGWIDGSAISLGQYYPLMDVPIIQQRDLSNPSRDLISGCEITAVTMMLRYAGANVDKVQLAAEMPRSTDPNKGYVGDPYKGGSGGGWTIYPPALMDLVKKYAGSAVDLTNKNLESQLVLLHPVVVWMTMHGFTVHAITLTGFDANNFYYNDPWTGEKNALMSKNDFYKNWTTQKNRAISY